ncbi:hypothetical protein [Streptomyces sp. cmx-18-6]|uniref:hypothetical protein n=1 Tax=Streptomyces sp. cmx-18-6 TaxID=2790930 RepID=UPI00397FFFA3
MNTTPSQPTGLSKTTTPADDTDATSTDDAVTEDAAEPSKAAADEPDGTPETDPLAEAGHGDDDLADDPFAKARHGVGAGAAAVVSTALGIVALTGAWSSRVAAERETLIGQIKTSGGGSPAQQISEIYGDAWHATALGNGVFAVLALLVGVFVLVRPAFGTPAERPQPAWVRAVALAGVALGALGVLISVGMYFDLFLALPVAGVPAG